MEFQESFPVINCNAYFTNSPNPQFTLIIFCPNQFGDYITYGRDSSPRVFVKTQILESWSPFIILI